MGIKKAKAEYISVGIVAQNRRANFDYEIEENKKLPEKKYVEIED